MNYMIDELKSNFNYVQESIDMIKRSTRPLDIKQISDLQRYTEMQKNIMQSIDLAIKRQDSVID